MRKISKKLKREIKDDPYYKKCARNRVFNDHECEGRITWEHSMEYQGRQLNEKWAILPICAKAHGVDEWQDYGLLDKNKHEAIALNRATDEELDDVSKAVDYKRKRDYYRRKYEIVGNGINMVSLNPDGE